MLSTKQIEFEKERAKFKIPLVGFFDFESNLLPVSEENQCLKCNEKKCEHKTRTEQVQNPSGYCLIIVNLDNEIVFKRSYTGPDPVNHMLRNLLENEEKIFSLMQQFPDHNLSPEEEREFQEATVCHICNESLFTDWIKNERDAVRDHCHMTGSFIGAAHSNCNLNRRNPCKLPLFCHNFMGYDSHQLLKFYNPNAAHPGREETLKCLPLNSEKVRTLEIGGYLFLDSMSFLQGSLSELALDLSKSGEKLQIVEQMRLAKSEDEMSLLLRKG